MSGYPQVQNSMAQKKGLARQGRHQLDVMRIWQWQPHTRPVQAGGDGDDHVCAMQCKPMCRYAIVVQRAAASPSFSPPTGSLETGHRRVHVAAPAPPRATDRPVLATNAFHHSWTVKAMLHIISLICSSEIHVLFVYLCPVRRWKDITKPKTMLCKRILPYTPHGLCELPSDSIMFVDSKVRALLLLCFIR
uniref:Uncharacterized protein n=1 Tax=Oryza nivara TaxID=4536 RepID=A0A0E0G7Q5_ORYNI